jgi:hypothetical protein
VIAVPSDNNSHADRITITPLDEAHIRAESEAEEKRQAQLPSRAALLKKNESLDEHMHAQQLANDDAVAFSEQNKPAKQNRVIIGIVLSAAAAVIVFWMLTS